jgi:Trk K+ transport system NAD-binding subunit
MNTLIIGVGEVGRSLGEVLESAHSIGYLDIGGAIGTRDGTWG